MATIKSYNLKNGTEMWEYFVSNGRNKGTGAPLKIHKRGFKSRKDAEKAAKIIEGEIASGEYLKSNPSKLTISDYFDLWINTYKTNVKEGTRIVHRSNITTYIDPYIGNFKLDQYTRREHQQYINMLLNKKGLGRTGKGLSIRTVKTINATLSNGFKKAIQLGYLKDNPTNFAEFPREESSKEPKYYTLEQADKFLEYAKQEKQSIWYPFFLTIFDCGLRKGEAMALQWSDIDLKNKTIDISKERLYRAERGENAKNIALDNTKTESGKRLLIMTTRMQKAFIELYSVFYEAGNTIPITKYTNDFIFLYDNGNIVRSRSVNGAFDRIIKKAGLPKIKVHDGRHTYAVRLRQAGVPLEDIKDLLGHKDVSTTQIYAQISPEVKKRATDILDDYIENSERKASGQIINFSTQKNRRK
ncbi:tyrosine-type recombinase/integrase [Enterococcus italicus]|uniref:tyrosine-type recombinase/integrase n=1 Tax=Enterococcus italicus TaxID=246144 RepID=UPI003F45762E